MIITKTLFHNGIYLTSVNLPYVPQCEVNKITKYGLKIKIDIDLPILKRFFYINASRLSEGQSQDVRCH